MAYPQQFASDPVGRLAAELKALRDQALKTRKAAFVLPVLDADPEPDDPTNLWAFDDGRIRWRGTDGTVHQFVPTADQQYRIRSLSAAPPASSGIDFYRHSSSDEFRIRRPDGSWARYAPITAASTTDGGGGTSAAGSTTSKAKVRKKSPRTFRKTYAPTWGRTMCPVHGPEGGGEVTFGRWSGTHGQRRVMLGFNDAAIRADLAGATIRRVEITARTTHFYANSGGTIRWGGHNRSDPPGGYSAVRRNVFAAHWPKVGVATRGGTGSVTWIGRAFRDNRIKGLVVDQLSDSVGFYGRLVWGSVRLRITYTTTNY